MNLDDFKPQWQQRQRDLDNQVDHVVKKTRSRMSSFNRMIWWRDMRETGVALALMVWFCFDLFHAKNLLGLCGAATGVLACITTVCILHWAREKGKVVRTEMPLQEYCQAELTRVDRQIWLLRNVHWWGLGPLLISIILSFASMVTLAVDLILIPLLFLFLILPVFGFAYWLNLLAVKNDLLPLRRELTDAMDPDGQVVDTEDGLPRPTIIKRRHVVIAFGAMAAICILCLHLGISLISGHLLNDANVASNAPRVSPFTAVRFEDERVLVTFQGNEYQWLELDGIQVENIVAAAKGRFWLRWQKRVKEDLVDVLWKMGHRPSETVALRLLDLKTNEERVVDDAPMTSENRAKIYWQRIMEERKTEGNQPANELSDDQVCDLVIDQQLRARLVGRYQIFPNFIFDVRDRDGHLMVGITNQQTQEVFPDSATRWSYRSVDAMLEFKLGTNGPAKRLILHQNDRQQSAMRIDE